MFKINNGPVSVYKFLLYDSLSLGSKFWSGDKDWQVDFKTCSQLVWPMVVLEIHSHPPCEFSVLLVKGADQSHLFFDIITYRWR